MYLWCVREHKRKKGGGRRCVRKRERKRERERERQRQRETEREEAGREREIIKSCSFIVKADQQSKSQGSSASSGDTMDITTPGDIAKVLVSKTYVDNITSSNYKSK